MAKVNEEQFVEGVASFTIHQFGFRHSLQAYENRTTQPYRFMLFAFDWRFVSGQGRVLWNLIFSGSPAVSTSSTTFSMAAGCQR